MFTLQIGKDNDNRVVVRLKDGDELLSMVVSKNTIHRSDLVNVLNDFIIELDATDYIRN
jgi:hypothetical protein